MSARRWPLVVAALAAAALLTGCAGDGTVLDLGDGATAYVSPEPLDGNRSTALVSGTLQVSAGGCLVLDVGAGGRYFLGLPDGTGAARSAVSVTSGGGRELAVGDVVTGGGGFTEDEGWRDVVRDQWSDVPDDCLAETRGLASVYDLTGA